VVVVVAPNLVEVAVVVDWFIIQLTQLLQVHHILLLLAMEALE
jgi:hypothetical protein